MRASAPVPGDWLARQRRAVAVPVSGTLPRVFRVIAKSGPPVGNGAEQLEGPVRMLFSSEKYPSARSCRVGPAIKSCVAKVATASVGELRSTGNTAPGFDSDSGNFEK